MKKPAALLTLLVTGIVAITGCGRSHDLATPTAPTVVVPPTGSAVSGTITIGSVSHVSGSTLQLQPCPTVQGHTSGPQLCNDQLQVTIDVTTDSDIPNAALRVTFADKAQRCGFASSARTTIVGGTRISLTTSLITFVQKDADPGQPADLGCDLPPAASAIDITDIAVTLVNLDSPPQYNGVMRSSFPSRYTFALPQVLTLSRR